MNWSSILFVLKNLFITSVERIPDLIIGSLSSLNLVITGAVVYTHMNSAKLMKQIKSIFRTYINLIK